jgi:hypothetical protein
MAVFGLIGLLVVFGFEFEDFDCLFVAPPILQSFQPAGYVPSSWADFRQTSLKTPFEIDTTFLYQVVTNTGNNESCFLGVVTACLLLSIKDGPKCDAYTDYGSPLILIRSGWPVSRLLEILWEKNLKQVNPEATHELDCTELYHPSIDWKSYRTLLYDSLSKWDHKLVQQAMDSAYGVTWKIVNTAIHEPSGMTVKELSELCPLGIAVTNLYRALGTALAPAHSGDTLKLFEAYLHIASPWLRDQKIRDLLHSAWPYFPPLRVMQGFVRFRKRDQLRVNPYKFTVYDEHCKEQVLLIQIKDIGMLQDIIAKLIDFNLLSKTRFVLSSDSDKAECDALLGGSSLCLPVISPSPLISRYLYIHGYLKNSETVFYITSDVVILKSDFMEELSIQMRSAPILIIEELFSRRIDIEFYGFRRSEAATKYLDAMLTYIFRSPYPDEKAAAYYLFKRHENFGYVPNVSFLSDEVLHLEYKILPFNLFAPSEGFSGPIENVRSISLNCDSHLFKHKITECEELRKSLWTSYEYKVLFTRGAKIQSPFVKTPKGGDTVNSSIYTDDSIYNRTDIVASHKIEWDKTGILSDFEYVDDHALEPHANNIFHINYASNCCKLDQRQSSYSAVKYFASKSFMLNEKFLDDSFIARNQDILSFNRTGLTKSKSPSNLIGYYVWKPYVILKTLNLLPENSILVYTDAGIQFKKDLRPLIDQYSNITDVSGIITEMQEMARSKRDAFVILDSDHPSVAITNQVATGVIIMKNTPKVREFISWWLAALQTKFVISEEESKLLESDGETVKEYDGYINSNDDQTGFSLLFKKWGFQGFTWTVRNEYIDIVRNMAKFIAINDAYALGKDVDDAFYQKIADERAKKQQEAATQAVAQEGTVTYSK